MKWQVFCMCVCVCACACVCVCVCVCVLFLFFRLFSPILLQCIGYALPPSCAFNTTVLLTRSHELSLNSELVYCVPGKKSNNKQNYKNKKQNKNAHTQRWVFVWVFSSQIGQISVRTKSVLARPSPLPPPPPPPPPPTHTHTHTSALEEL